MATDRDFLSELNSLDDPTADPADGSPVLGSEPQSGTSDLARSLESEGVFDAVAQGNAEARKAEESTGILSSLGAAISAGIDKLRPERRTPPEGTGLDAARDRFEQTMGWRPGEGYGGQAGRAIARGVIGMVGAAGAGVQTFAENAAREFDPADPFDDGRPVEDGVLGAIRQAGKSVSEFSQRAQKHDILRRDVARMSDIRKEKWFGDLVSYVNEGFFEGVGSILTLGGTVLATGGFGGTAVLWAMGTGEVRQRFEQEGVAPDDHGKLIMMAGAVHGALEYIPGFGSVWSGLSKDARRAVEEEILKAVAKGFLKGSSKEGITEGLQTAVELASVTYGKTGSEVEAALRTLRDVQEGAASEILNASVQGALAGGPFGALHEAQPNRKPQEDKVREARVRTGLATDAGPQTSPTGEQSPPDQTEPREQPDLAAMAKRTDGATGETKIRSFRKPEPTPEAQAAMDKVKSLIDEPGIYTESSGQTSLVPEVTDKERLQVQADKPLRGGNAPLDVGLFGSGAQQIDLEDMLAKVRQAEQAPQSVPEPRASGEAQPLETAETASPGSTAGQEASSQGVTQAQREAFAKVLASKTVRKAWGKVLGVDEPTLKTLMDEAVEDGRLDASYRRTKTAARGRPQTEHTANSAPLGRMPVAKETVPSSRSAQSAPVLDRATERRIEAIKSPVARAYAQDLIGAERDAADFASVVSRLKADKKATKAVLDEIGAVYGLKQFKSKAAAIDALTSVRGTTKPGPQLSPKQSAKQSLDKEPKPVSIVEFLRARGGIKDTDGDLKAMGAIKQRPGLVNNKSGMDLDTAREIVVEAGYITDIATVLGDEQATSTTSDLLDAISEELGGRKVYRPDDRARIDAAQDAERASTERQRIVDELMAFHDENSLPFDMTEREIEYAGSLIAQGTDIDTAVESAYLQTAREITDDETDGGRAPQAGGDIAAESLGRSFDDGETAVRDAGREGRGAGQDRGEGVSQELMDKGRDKARAHVLRLGRQHSREYGAMVLPDGSMKANRVPTGARKIDFLMVTQETAPDLFTGPARSVDFHHNHPRSTSFSRADYTEAAVRPALRRTYVHGHDGSQYWAELLYDSETLGGAYDLARTATERVGETGLGMPRYRTHLIAEMMREAGVIKYNAEMTPADAQERIADLKERMGDAWGEAVALIGTLKRLGDVLDQRAGPAGRNQNLAAAPQEAQGVEPDIAGGPQSRGGSSSRSGQETGGLNVSDRPQDLERDWRDGPPQDGVGQTDVPLAGRPDDGSPQQGRETAEPDGRPDDGGGLPAGDAAVVGEGGDLAVQGGAPGDGAPAAGGRRGGRGGDAGGERVPPGRAPEAAVVNSAPARSPLELAIAAQREADATVPFVANDPENIRASLPLLKPGQQEDVIKAENRFSRPDGHGFLFTNGTGTGKTFTGLGIVKRFAAQGKSNVLIIAPSQGILDGWIASGRMIGLDISRLPDTGSAGTGIVATTYANLRENAALADRQWDLLVADEAHHLSMNASGNPSDALNAFRGLSGKSPWQRARFKLQAQSDELAQLREAAGSSPQIKAEYSQKLEAYNAQLTALTKQYEQEPRAKALFLSATPFAYRKSTDWAEGFLFDYEPDSHAYGVPGGQGAFLVRNFGYNFRYNRAEEPGPEVNVSVLEREFYERLKREGVLSGRRLDVEADYDRRFVLVDDAVGAKIDQAMDWLNTTSNGRYRPLADAFREKFDYLAQRRLLEAIKAKHVIPRIKRDLELGRKVVVFHDYNEGGGINAFAMPDNPNERVRAPYGEVGPTIGELYGEFVRANPYVKTLNFAQFKSPLETLTKAFPQAFVYNGRVPNKQRAKARDEFNRDGSGRDIIIVQSAAGEAGISLHDTTGKHQRVLYNLGLPTRPTTAIQQEGRIYREGQVSNAILRYMSTGTGWERRAFAQTIAERASTAENLALGDEARALRDAFIDAFADADVIEQGLGEGTGGKAKDRAGVSSASPFEKAKAFYFGELKTKGRRDQREGKDYYATPEPIGLKMVEFADIEFGERILEPSAGHGAIARWFPEGADRTLIEPSTRLASRAGLSSPGAKVIEGRFEDHYIGNKYDAIVMNPPFGVGGKDAYDHIQKAVGHLKMGGRVVAIMPRGGMADTRLDKFLDAPENKQIYRVGDIALPPVMFERAGTKVASRILILERHADPANAPMPLTRDLSDADTINDLFDRIEGLSWPKRRRGEQTAPRPVRPVQVQPDQTVQIAPVETVSARQSVIETKVAAAAEAGRAAFVAGKTAVPALDSAVLALLKDTAVGEANAVLDAWTQAWHRANAEAPVVEVDAAQTQPAVEPVAASEAVPRSQGEVVGGTRFKSGETTHGKTGEALFVASMADFVPRPTYEKLRDIAKTYGGYYSTYRGAGAIPGFQFRSAESRKAFVEAAKLATGGTRQSAKTGSFAEDASAREGKIPTAAEIIAKRPTTSLKMAMGRFERDAIYRQRMADALNRGESVRIDDKTIEFMRSWAQRAPQILPGTVPIRWLNRAVSAPNGMVEAHFQGLDGTVEIINIQRNNLARARGFFKPSDRGGGFFGGQAANPWVGFVVPHFSTHDGFVSLDRELWHEAIHALRALSLIGGGDFRLLVAHANALGIMDLTFGEFLSAAKGQEYTGSDASTTLKDIYSRAYANRGNVHDLIDEEAVAHMTELLVSGVDLPLPEDIRQILERIETGEMAGRQPMINGLKFAIGGTSISVDEKIENMEAAQKALEALPRRDRRALNDTFDVITYPSVGRATYYVVQKGKPLEDKHGNILSVGRFDVKPAQRMDVTGVEVTNARVEVEYQRKGIASAVYDMVDRDMQSVGGLSPSPRDQLSPDAVVFWSKRLPGMMFAMGGHFSKETAERKAIATHFGATRIETIGENDPHPGRVLAYHGTSARFIERGEKFDVERSADFGMHFGTPDQATRRLGYDNPALWQHAEGERVIPVVIDASRVVDLPDLHTWPVLGTAQALEDRVPELVGLVEDIEAAEGDGRAVGDELIRRRLTAAGIDAIRYRNATEGSGWSYIVWQEGKVIAPFTGEPLMAMGSSEAGRQSLLRLKMGLDAYAPTENVAVIFDAIQPVMAALPADVDVGVLDRIEPTGTKRGLTFVFRLMNGSERSLPVNLSADEAVSLRAGFINGEPLGLRSIIGFTRLYTAANLGQISVGETWHEIGHAKRTLGMIPDDDFAALVGHADALGVMDRAFIDHAMLVGAPDALDADPSVTLRETYEYLYANRSNIKESMAQEAMAHMLESAHHGGLSEEDLAPIRDLLDKHFPGLMAQVAARQQALRDAALRAPQLVYAIGPDPSTAQEVQEPYTNKDGFILKLPFKAKWGNPRFNAEDKARAIDALKQIKGIKVRTAKWADLVQAQQDMGEILLNLYYFAPDSNMGQTASAHWTIVSDYVVEKTGLRPTDATYPHSLLSPTNADTIAPEIQEIVVTARAAVDHLLDQAKQRRAVVDLLRWNETAEPKTRGPRVRPDKISDKMPSGFYFQVARDLAKVPDNHFNMGGRAVLNYMNQAGVKRAELEHFQLWEKFGNDEPTTRGAFEQAIAERMFDFRRKMMWWNPERPTGNYDHGGTRVSDGPRIPGRGMYFERLMAFPKTLKNGAVFPPGFFESPHWSGELKSAWASWRGSLREVEGWGKVLVGEEGQTDYMQGRVSGRRPGITTQEFLDEKKNKAQYEKVMDKARRLLITGVGYPFLGNAHVRQLHRDLRPAEAGTELPLPEWTAFLNDARALARSRNNFDENSQPPVGFDIQREDEQLRALDELEQLRKDNEALFAPGARAKYAYREPGDGRTPETPIDESYVRTMVRDLLLLAAQKDVDTIAIATSETTNRIQANTHSSAAHFYDEGLKPALEKELRRQTGDGSLTLEIVKLPKAMGSPRNEKAYTVWAARLPQSLRDTVSASGQMVFAFGGERARTADLGSLAKAKQMEADGFARNDIRQATGWFRDPSENWRFEISDAKATLKAGRGKLGDIIDHPELFKAYPELKNIPVGDLPDNAPKEARGSYLPKIDKAGFIRKLLGAAKAQIMLGKNVDRGTVLHETQHAIDDIEGALAGLDRNNPYGPKAVSPGSAAYQDAPFEKSARAVEARADMRQEELEARAPWLDYGGSKKPKGKVPPTAIAKQEWQRRNDMDILPERLALEEAYKAAYGSDIGKYPEYLKGHYNTPEVIKRHSIIRDLAAESSNPKARAFAAAFDAYREIAQRLGHNGGPDPSTWGEGSGPFLYAFAGERARTADLAALDRAKKMEAEGPQKGAPEYDEHRTRIFTETGWFRGVDRKWKFEIDDSGAIAGRTPSRMFGRAARLEEGMTHPLLYEAYPELARNRARMVIVPTEDDELGAFGTKTSWMGRPKNLIMTGATNIPRLKAMTLHEIQHAIEQKEGFAGGGNIDDDATPTYRGEFTAKLVEQRDDILRQLGFDDETLRRMPPDFKVAPLFKEEPDMDADVLRLIEDIEAAIDNAARIDGYYRLAGEVESRTVEKRMDMTAEERRARPPWLDYDVPEDQQIVRWADDATGGPMYAFGPFRSNRNSESIAAAIDGFKDAIGLTAVQGLKGYEINYTSTDTAGNPIDRTLKINPADGRSRTRAMFGNTWVGRGTHRVDAQYDRRGGIARTRSARDLNAVVHEGAHHLVEIIGAPLLDLIDAHQGELSLVATSADINTPLEQFAEWFRNYVTDRAYAQRVAPSFLDAFEDLMDAEMPGSVSGLANATGQIAAYMMLNPMDRHARDLVSGARMSTIEEMARSYRTGNLGHDIAMAMSNIYTDTVSRSNTTWHLVSRMIAKDDAAKIKAGRPEDRITLPKEKDPYVKFRMLPGAYKRGHDWLVHGVTDPTTNQPIAPPLRDAVALMMGPARGGHLAPSLGAAVGAAAGWLSGGPTGAVVGSVLASHAVYKALNINHWNTGIWNDFGAYAANVAKLERWNQLEQKQEELRGMANVLANGTRVRGEIAKRLSFDDAKLDRRRTALTRIETMLAMKRRELGVAETALANAQERIGDISAALIEDQAAIDDGSDVAKGDRKRHNRSMSRANQKSAELARAVEKLSTEVDELDVMRASVTNEAAQLSDIVDAARERLAELDDGLTAVRAEIKAREDRGASRPPDAETKDAIIQAISEAEAKYPQIKDALSILHDFMEGVLEVEYRKGRWTPEQYDQFKASARWYVPLLRDMSDIPEVRTASRVAARQFRKVHGFFGSDRAIYNPLDMIIERAYQSAFAIAQNDFVRSIVDLTRSIEGGVAEIAEEVRPEDTMFGDPETMDRLKRNIRELTQDDEETEALFRLLEHDLPGSAFTVIRTPAGKVPKAGLTVPFYENGERKLLKINDVDFAARAYETINGLGTELSDIFMNLIAKPTRLFAMGATMAPGFAVVNLVRDTFAAWVYERATPIITQMSGIAMELSTWGGWQKVQPYLPQAITAQLVENQRLVRIYHDAGGIRGGQFVSFLGDTKDTGDWKGLRHTGLAYGGKFWEAIELAETANRLGVFKKIYRTSIDKGVSESEAIADAAYRVRDLMDFDERGSRMMAATRIVAFLNPFIRDIDKQVREFSGSTYRGSAVASEIQRAVKIVMKRDAGAPLTDEERAAFTRALKIYTSATAMTLFFVALYMLNADDDEIQEVDNRKRSQGEPFRLFGHILFMPKPHSLAAPANTIIELIRSWGKDDPKTFDRIRQSLYDVYAPPVIPQPIAGYFETVTGYDRYRKKPIVPKDMQDLSPQLQFDEFTSNLGRKIGEMTGASPMKVDHFIKSQFATLGREAMRLSEFFPGGRPKPNDTVDPIIKRAVLDPYRGSNALSKVYSEMRGEGNGGPGDLIADFIFGTGHTYLRSATDYLRLMDTQGLFKAKSWVQANLPEEYRAYAYLAGHFGQKALKQVEGFTEDAQGNLVPDLRNADDGLMERASKRYREVKAAQQREMVHPLNRLDKVLRVIGGLKMQINQDAINVGTPRSPELARLSKGDREMAIDMLNKIAVAEARNGFITMGHGVWKGATQMPIDDMLDTLKAISPTVYTQLMSRIDRAGIPTMTSTVEAWEIARKGLLAKQEEADAEIGEAQGRLVFPDHPLGVRERKDVAKPAELKASFPNPDRKGQIERAMEKAGIGGR